LVGAVGEPSTKHSRAPVEPVAMIVHGPMIQPMSVNPADAVGGVDVDVVGGVLGDARE